MSEQQQQQQQPNASGGLIFYQSANFYQQPAPQTAAFQMAQLAGGQNNQPQQQFLNTSQVRTRLKKYDFFSKKC